MSDNHAGTFRSAQQPILLAWECQCSCKTGHSSWVPGSLPCPTFNSGVTWGVLRLLGSSRPAFPFKGLAWWGHRQIHGGYQGQRGQSAAPGGRAVHPALPADTHGTRALVLRCASTQFTPLSHTFAHCTYRLSLAGHQHVHFHTLRAFHSAHTLLHLPTCLHTHSAHTATFIPHNQHI